MYDLLHVISWWYRDQVVYNDDENDEGINRPKHYYPRASGKLAYESHGLRSNLSVFQQT